MNFAFRPLVWLALGSMLCASFAQAKIFRNSYVSFELPDNWECVLEHTEWVCRSQNEKQSKEAIIILTAKEVGPTDTLEQYEAHLKNPMPTSYKGTGTNLSKVVIPPQRTQVNNQIWIDSLHQGSEIGTYYTRYLTTVRERIAVLVTLSAHKDQYNFYSQQFFRAVNSLRVIATAPSVGAGGIRPSGSTGVLGAGAASTMSPELGAALSLGDEGDQGGGSSGTKTRDLILAIAIGLLGLGVYVYLKIKRN